MVDTIGDTSTLLVNKVSNLITSDTISAKEKLDIVSQYIPKIIDWAIRTSLKILLAVAILMIGFWVVKKFKKIFIRILDRHKVEPSVSSFLVSLCMVILKVLVVFMAIGIVGFDTTSIVALLGAAGLGIGMALSGTLQNFAGGIVLLSFKPFRVGDFIESNGVSGTISEVQIFMTVLKTPDNKTLYVPNSTLISHSITNFTKEKQRRVDFEFTVAYGTNLEQAREVIKNIIDSDKRILKTPEHTITISKLAESSVVINVRFWANSEDYWNLKFDITETVYNEFNKNKIEIPFPQMQVHVKKSE